MTIVEWLHSFFPKTPSSDRAEASYYHALAAADELHVANLSLQQQLAPFRRAKDPFSAIRRAASLADSWERPQEAAIHKGPLRL
jgi:hypothetical protein